MQELKVQVPLGDPKRTKYEVIKVKYHSQWRPQNVENARNIRISTKESCGNHVDSTPDKSQVLEITGKRVYLSP